MERTTITFIDYKILMANAFLFKTNEKNLKGFIAVCKPHTVVLS